MAVDRTLILFLRVDLQTEDGEGEPTSLRLHTGIGTFYPKTSKWSDYLGSGGLLKISSIVDDSTTAASDLNVELEIPDRFEKRYNLVNLFDRIRSANLENREVCIHMAQIEDLKDTANLPEPFLLMVGRIANIEINVNRIQMRVYSAGTLLNQVVGGPSQFTDITHKRFIDSTDQCMRNISSDSFRDVVFP